MNREDWNKLDELLGREGVRDTILGHREMCRLLERQGIEPTKNLDKHFPYRDVGCKGLICPNCGSKRLWIVKRDWRADFSKIDSVWFDSNVMFSTERR